MSNCDSTFVDVRWRETGWEEAFRIRLSGWLPPSVAVSGASKGVIRVSPNERLAKLTLKGSELTRLSDPSMSRENIAVLAEVLGLRKFSRAWLLEPGTPEIVRLDQVSRFDSAFRDAICNALGVSTT